MHAVTAPLAGFDESAYLTANPDVVERMKSGDFSSGWQHYLAFGYREHRLGISPELEAKVTQVVETLEMDAAERPVPPPHLRERVHGSADLSSFDKIGRMISFNMYAALEAASIGLPAHARFLDFGCGCGRVMRPFHNLYPQSDFYGVDIDGEAVAWCAANLSAIGTFIETKARPPLPFDDGFFDFVFSVSIFTHLPEDLQLLWLEELRRVTKVGGYLLLTTHGPDLFPICNMVLRRMFMPSGFFYSPGIRIGNWHKFYQTAFHTEDYISSRWEQFFEVKAIIRRGIANRQDIVLCRRRQEASFSD